MKRSCIVRTVAADLYLLSYRSIRIDAVHYCAREAELATKRKRKSFFERNGDPVDVPQHRLRALSRTVWENSDLAFMVQYLKMPYMTREGCRTDLARLVSVLPSLCYIDLPDGFYSDDGSTTALRQELQSRCPDLRYMKFTDGAEGAFSMLAQSKQWRNLELLELVCLDVDIVTLLMVLSSFQALQKVRLKDIHALDDSVFCHDLSYPSFPPIASLALEKTPRISEAGILAHLSIPQVAQKLTSLSLSNTGIPSSMLYKILATTPSMKILRISETIDRPLSLSAIPPLTSRSLQTLHYDILSSTNSPHTFKPPSESYYTYLAHSILSGRLPSLVDLYTPFDRLTELLLHPPTASLVNTGLTAQRPSNTFSNQTAYPGLFHPLRLYTKSAAGRQWDFTLISPPPAHNRRASPIATRPTSAYSMAPLSPTWTITGESSHITGSSPGSFLAVPGSDSHLASGLSNRRSISEDGGWMG